MSFYIKINNFRRNLMEFLTSNVGKKYKLSKVRIENKSEIKRILVIRPNHRLGNLLMLTPLIQRLEEVFPNAEINLFVKGTISPIIFKNYHTVHKIVQLPRKPFKELWKYFKTLFFLRKGKYDLVINVDRGSSSGKLFTKFSNGIHKIFGEVDNDTLLGHPDYIHMATSTVFCLNQVLKQSNISNEEIFPTLNIRLENDELSKAKTILNDLVDTSKPTISIFTFATGTKCYSKEWWDKFYTRLKEKYADKYNIVEVLPVENVSQIDFKAPSYYSKDIREIAGFFKNTKVFIGADSGMMHLASASGTPTLGLFSVTSEQKYRPYGNESRSINTEYSNIEDWIVQIDSVLEK